ncbi:TolC family protein [Stenotrophomonas sp. YIM B06876]|uniref:TolC family protein n=1 Tax=Stenotrophomonas sp. YIM B06876 TaxID=3060211 RepID=UPI002738E2A3|nr:TolC family protein [Stenotrophomonas sp. YIM B06876]
MKPNPIVAPVILALLLSPVTAHALSLAEAEQAMQVQNPELEAARIELRGAQGDLLAARRRPPAELALGTSKISPLEGVGSGRWQHKRMDSTLGLGWTWERGGKRRLRIGTAQAGADAAALELLDSQRQQRLALHEAYFGVKAAQLHLQVAQENRAASARALAAAELQLTSGAIAPIERNRLAVEDLKVEAESHVAEQELLEARSELALLIGHSAALEQLSADDPWPALLSGGMLEPAPGALEQRADLLAAQARVDAADAARALARSQRRRDVQLGLEAEREPTDIGGVSWGMSISVPLNGPNHYRGEWQRAEADYDAAVLERNRLRSEARLQLLQVQQQLQAANVRLAQYEQQLLPAARQALDGMELAYRRGAATLTDLLDARRTWREADSDLIDARLLHAVTLARWQALGTLPSLQGTPSR